MYLVLIGVVIIVYAAEPLWFMNGISISLNCE